MYIYIYILDDFTLREKVQFFDCSGCWELSTSGEVGCSGEVFYVQYYKNGFSLGGPMTGVPLCLQQRLLFFIRTQQ